MRGPTLLTTIFVATVTVTLAAPAQAAPPTADSGPNQTAPVGTDVVLQGSASDPDGDPLEIQWIQSVIAGGDLSSCTFTGPTSYEPISPAGLMPTLNCTQAGQYLFQLAAADETDFDDSLGALITFTENNPPTVDSGPDQTAPAGTDVMLDGSASDPDGQPLEIRWLRSVIAGGDLSSCTFSGPTSFEPISPAGLMPTFNCTQPGDYLVQLVAGDGFEAVDDIGALVTFTEPMNNPPMVSSGPDQMAPAGTDVVLQGSASDPDGDPLEIEWLLSVIADGDLSSCTFTGPTSFEPISPAGLMPTFNCTEPGDYLVQLVAGDGIEAVDDIGALVTFTELMNSPPTADSGPDQMAPAGTDVVLQGSASDPDGDPLEIQWLLSEVAGDLSSCTFTGPTSFEPISPAGLMPTLNCTEPGQYLAQLVAADGMDFEDSLGALITFTEEPIDDLTAPTCTLGKITRRGATVLVTDSESGVASIRTRKRFAAFAWPWARRYDPPEPSVTVIVRRVLPWLGGLVGIETVNGQGLKSTCWVVLPTRGDPLVINYPGGTD
jgi:hypothetical protein